MTYNMRLFIEHNSMFKIIEGIRLNNKGTEYKAPSEGCGGIKYKFSNGAVLVLTKEDINSNKDYQPVWDI